MTAPKRKGKVDHRARARAVIERVRAGSSERAACGLERVPRSLFYEWMAADEELALELERARAASEEDDRARLEELIAEGAKTANVQLHKMATRYRDWAPPKQRVEQSGPNGGPQKVEHSGSVVLRGDAVRIARTKKEGGE